MTPRLLGRFEARAGARRATSMLHPECPIEQSLHSADPQVQGNLLQEIWHGNSFVEKGALLVADPKGLRVLARSEGALREPVEALFRTYGAALTVEPPSVRYAHGAPVLEPYMMLLLCGPARLLPLVQQDLSRRRGHVRRLDQHSGLFVLEAEAPLGYLLGYGDWLHQWTDGRVDTSQWLSRYLPIDDGGPLAA